VLPYVFLAIGFVVVVVIADVAGVEGSMLVGLGGAVVYALFRMMQSGRQ
jgi:hypothetical protein